MSSSSIHFPCFLFTGSEDYHVLGAPSGAVGVVYFLHHLWRPTAHVCNGGQEHRAERGSASGTLHLRGNDGNNVI